MPTKPPIIGFDEGLTQYLRRIKNFPMLTPEDEFMLAQRLRHHGDAEAAHALVTSHLRLVVKIAMGYRAYGLPVGDLIAEGNVGMMQAVKRFDPDRGFRLASYAAWWIRAAIQEHVLHNWSLVKIGTTAAQKKLFFNLRRLKQQIQGIDGGQLTPDAVRQIATALEVNEAEVMSMDLRLGGRDQSLNAPMRIDGEDERQDWLADETDGADVQLAERDELEKRRKLLTEALKGLSQREHDVLTQRSLSEAPTPLNTLSRHYGVSRERIRQIELRAIEKLRKAVKADGIEEPSRIVSLTPPPAHAARYPAAMSRDRARGGFSRSSKEDNWRAGDHDTMRTLRRPEILERSRGVEGIFSFDLAPPRRLPARPS
jgi:RNA polymerase sigma-32 factor